MTETAGWGVPSWLPRNVQRSIALSEAERERLAGERHNRALEA
jgi:hypothetical protein